MSQYEVKCPQTWAWYSGYVHDFNEREKKLYIKYPDDWKSPEWMEVASVRHKYDESLMSPSWRPVYKEEVECKARAEEQEPYGWWPCKAMPATSDPTHLSSSSSSYSVAFLGWPDSHNEVLGIDFLRKKSKAVPLSDRNMHKEVYSVPSELKQWTLAECAKGTLLDTLMPHRNISSQIIHIAYSESTNKLMLIGHKRVLTNMKQIIFCFFEKRKSLLKLEQRTTQIERASQLKKEAELRAEKFTFNVHPLLSGYLRGRKGFNIEQVMRFNPNVIRIQPQNGSCYIAAKDKSSLERAVDALHMVCRKVIIPRDEMGQIIGRVGQQIQDIKHKSQVIKIISWKLWPKEFRTLKDIQMQRYQYAEEGRQEREAIRDMIRETNMDNLFNEDDIIDLSDQEKEKEKDIIDMFQHDVVTTSGGAGTGAGGEREEAKREMDALVIIGRKSRVQVCIFMIEMTLAHFRQISKTRDSVRDLRRKINKIKGNRSPRERMGPRNGNRDRNARDRRDRNARDRRLDEQDRSPRSPQNNRRPGTSGSGASGSSMGSSARGARYRPVQQPKYQKKKTQPTATSGGDTEGAPVAGATYRKKEDPSKKKQSKPSSESTKDKQESQNVNKKRKRKKKTKPTSGEQTQPLDTTTTNDAE